MDIDYHLEESKIIYKCVEKYVEALNSNSRLRLEVSGDERQLLDEALFCFEINPQKISDLINT